MKRSQSPRFQRLGCGQFWAANPGSFSGRAWKPQVAPKPLVCRPPPKDRRHTQATNSGLWQGKREAGTESQWAPSQGGGPEARGLTGLRPFKVAWALPVLEKPVVLRPPFWAPQTPPPTNQLGSISTRTYCLTSPLQVHTWGNLGTLTSAFPGWQSFWKGSRQAEEKQRPARWGACPLAGVGRGLEPDVSSLGKRLLGSLS